MTQSQAKALFTRIAGFPWRDGCTTSESKDGTICAYYWHRLIGFQTPGGGIVRIDPISGKRHMID